jgi:outer membrane protein
MSGTPAALTHSGCETGTPHMKIIASMGLMAAALMAAGPTNARDWTVTVGAKTTAAPPYEGADHSSVGFSPTLSIRPADRPYRFTPPDGGTSITLLSSKHFDFGPMARFRDSRDNKGPLLGLDKVKWAAEPGVFLDIWPFEWLRVHSEARHGVGGHHGMVADTGFDLIRQGDKWDLSLGGRTGWGDKRYLADYFGVSPLEAARSPLINAAYMPGGGRRYEGVTVGAAYHVTTKLKIRGFAGYQRLAEKAGDSPIVSLAGSRDQYAGSLGITYDFNFGI